jgi:hypothetical protein
MWPVDTIQPKNRVYEVLVYVFLFALTVVHRNDPQYLKMTPCNLPPIS